MIWKYEISGIYFVAMSSLDLNPGRILLLAKFDFEGGKPT